MKDIVLIHGTWCDGNVWGEFKNKLEELGLRVHTPSLRYHDLPYEEVEQKVGISREFRRTAFSIRSFLRWINSTTCC